VFVITQNKGATYVQKRQVILGERFVGEVEVISGLTPDEAVVTHGVQKVRDAQAVSVQMAAALATPAELAP
jgi:membrane fusion protein (multidrug efflux system)